MAISDLLNKLEAAVDEAKGLQEEKIKAESALADATDSYNKAAANVESLKNEVTTAIGNIFPNTGSVRQY